MCVRVGTMSSLSKPIDPILLCLGLYVDFLVSYGTTRLGVFPVL